MAFSFFFSFLVSVKELGFFFSCFLVLLGGGPETWLGFKEQVDWAGLWRRGPRKWAEPFWAVGLGLEAGLGFKVSDLGQVLFLQKHHNFSSFFLLFLFLLYKIITFLHNKNKLN